MLDLKKYSKFYYKDPPVSELLSWAVLATPSVVRCKDESLFKVYEFKGIDADGLSEKLKGTQALNLEKNLKQLDDRFSVEFILVRKKTTEYPSGNFNEPAASFIDKIRHAGYIKTEHFINYTYIVISLKYSFDKSKSVYSLMFEKDKVQTLKRMFSEDRTKQMSLEEFNERIEIIEEKSTQAVSSLSSLDFTELKDEKLLASLYFILNPAEDKKDTVVLPDYSYLDQYLANFDINGDYEDTLVLGDNFYKILSVNEFPLTTRPGKIDALLSIPYEFKLSLGYSFMDKDAVKKQMNTRRRHYKVTRKGISTQLTEVVSHDEKMEDPTKGLYITDVNEAMIELENVQRPFGQFFINIAVFGKNTSTVDKAYLFVNKVFSNSGFLMIKETIGKLGAYFSALPCNQKLLRRKYLLSLGNFADLIPIRQIMPGEKTNEHLSLTYKDGKAPAPALMVLDTIYKVPYFFNLHVKDSGHTAMFGPPGAGKSVFLNFTAAQYLKYNPRIFIFDNGYSSYILAKAVGGLHIDFNPEKEIYINPVLNLDTEEEKVSSKEFIELLLTAHGYILNDSDYKELYKAIELMSKLKKKSHILGGFINLLPDHLAAKLRAWTVGEYKNFFNNYEDRLAISDYTVFEMRKLYEYPHVITPLLKYLFKKIEESIDGIRPTLIILDECWFYLEHPVFVKKMKEWLKLLRKKNAVVIFATQSLSDTENVKEIFSTVMDSCKTKIFLPNRTANTDFMKDLYCAKFGLTEKDYDLVVSGNPKKEYLIKKENFTRLGILQFEPEIVALLASDDSSRILADKYYDKDNPEWFREYVNAWKLTQSGLYIK